MNRGPFRAAIRAAIANPQLQSALDANARRRGAGRLAAFESLPDWRERRQRAHAVRAEVVENLQAMLDRFAANAGRHGMHVHRAADASDAVKMVMEIAQNGSAPREASAGPRPLLIAKSKSMVSEEIELNRALERAGHRVVETDLGEYIVQLRGEKPAHIITPAVHLLRGQVGALFEEKLGRPYTEDIGTLTNAARGALREVFLRADVGISGVNFGIVETGGICIVTNEGNGRMVATLPRVHIALMGMERLVPTMEDLGLMLSLLPRSATGQKLSVYTQLIHGPRRGGEVDGAIERHIVIVDNGRTRLWGSALRESLYCIRCGACLNACPVFREIGGHAYVDASGTPAAYPGPIGSIVSPGLGGVQMLGHLAQASTLCGACKDACPVDIDLPSLLTRVRAGEPESKPRNRAVALSIFTRLALQAYAWMAARPSVFRGGQRAAALGARLLAPRTEWMNLPAFTGWGFSKDLSKPARRPFRDRWQALQATQDDAAEKALGPGPARAERESTARPLKAPSIDLVSRLRDELLALGAEVEIVAPGGLTTRVEQRIRARAIQRILVWEQIDGLDQERLRGAGLDLTGEPDASIEAGITGCTCAVAETGTLVIMSGSGRPMSASLLPEVHIAVVQAGQIKKQLEDALRLPQVRDASASVFVSGPSRTADIEMTLTIGVHGPKDLLVFIVDPSADRAASTFDGQGPG